MQNMMYVRVCVLAREVEVTWNSFFELSSMIEHVFVCVVYEGLGIHEE